jgi:hypothetical protein
VTRHRTPDGEYDLGELITAAFDLDRSWTARALCLAWVDDKPTPWQVNKSQTVDGVSGQQMIKMALMVCSACPAQYDCCRFAVRGLMQAGTWAVGITNLGWLQEREDALEIIDDAEECGATLDPLITSLRRDS